jgi:hypothetical protein
MKLVKKEGVQWKVFDHVAIKKNSAEFTLSVLVMV